MSTQYLLNMENISKEYYGNRVLKNVTLSGQGRVKSMPSSVRERRRQVYPDEHPLWHAGHHMPPEAFMGTVEIEGQPVSI
jgi:simple sugar transport system ATP-binding protein